MTIGERVQQLRRRLLEHEDQEKLSGALSEDAFEHLATKMRCAMFLSGMCIGGALTALAMLHAYTALALFIGIEVVWIAWRGWPWEM
jgi:hypothetical protein